MNKFNVWIHPLEPSSQELVRSRLIRNLGHHSNWQTQFLLEFGGTIDHNLNEQATKTFAKQLREAGAKEKVIALADLEEKKPQLYRVVLM